MRGKMVVWAGAAALAAAVLALGLPRAAARFVAGADETPIVRVERGPFDLMVEATGELQAVRSAAVSTPTALDLWQFNLQYMVPEGSAVEEGQVVARLDAQDLMRQRIERDAEFRTSAGELEKKEKELERLLVELDAELAEVRVNLEKARLKASRSTEVVSRLELAEASIEEERLETELEITRRKREASLASAQAELKILRSRHDRVGRALKRLEEGIAAMQVRAPASGLVLYTRNQNDEKIRVGQIVWRGWTIMEIPDLSEMEVLAEVDEVDARHVRAGQRVAVVLEAQPNVTYQGRIERVSPLAKRKRWNQPWKIFEVTVSLDETNEEVMRPGMQVAARIVTERIPDVLSVPESAVEEGGRGTRLYLSDGGEPEAREVRLGRRSGGKVVVEDGVEEGEMVFTRPPETVK